MVERIKKNENILGEVWCIVLFMISIFYAIWPNRLGPGLEEKRNRLNKFRSIVEITIYFYGN